MARYKKPSDPRDSDLRPGWHGNNAPFPWFWLALGVVVTIIGVLLALMLINRMLSREPLATVLPTPTVIRLTAPATVPPSPTVVMPTPTPIPTFTPAPTRDLENPPAELAIGYYAVITGTGDAGLTLRAGPSTDTTALLRAPEGTRVRLIAGPEGTAEGDQFEWWQVRLPDGQEGWMAGSFLAPAPAPRVEP